MKGKIDKTKTYTRGGICIDDIQIGDIHYEYEPVFKAYIKVEVISLPVCEEDYWSWQSKNVKTGETINYGQSKHAGAYGLTLYDYEAYIGMEQI